MNRTDRIRQLGAKIEYPVWGMVLVLALLMVSPFVSNLIPFIVFMLCLYRVLRYDVRTFAVDYCLLIPFSALFRMPSGMSLLIWLCLVAAIWYFVRSKIRASALLITLLLLLNYMITRMQMNINDFVLCFGQIFILYVLLPEQNSKSAAQAIRAFCWSLTISSLYALLFRNTHYLGPIVGYEGEAIWGSGILRFHGLWGDPNYYSTLLVVGLALLCKLKESGKINSIVFWCMGALMAFFGILTYSKTFFLLFVLLGGIYIIWQFWSKKVFRGVFFTAAAMVAVLFVLYSEDSPFAVILDRLTSGTSLSDLTTGRSDLFIAYWDVITKDASSFLFGLGLNAPGLRKDPHNLYLEITYYMGAVGLVLMGAFFVSMLHRIEKQTPGFRKQNPFAKYIVVLLLLMLYFTLQGMFMIITYAAFFVAFLSLYVTKETPGSD